VLPHPHLRPIIEKPRGRPHRTEHRQVHGNRCALFHRAIALIFIQVRSNVTRVRSVHLDAGCRELLREGDGDHVECALRGVVAEQVYAVGAAGWEVHALLLDVTNDASLKAAAAAYGKTSDTLDVLVNNAGVAGRELRALAMRYAAPVCRELLPHLMLWTSYGATPPTPVIYEPMLYFTLQGIKRMAVGERHLDHRPGTFLIASIDVPVVCAVTDCSPERPYLGLALKLDPAAVAALLLDLPQGAERVLDAAQEELEPMTISPTTRAMEDALLRFVRLVEAPEDVPLLAPMIERELLYRVLQSEHAAVLRQFARSDSRLSQIHRAVKWIRAHLAEPLPVETLADVASMSASSFHRHFKAVTGLSPLAYHKQMRLREARRRLLLEPGAVASVAFSVGYESASQFSREYTREFGLPPARDAARLRAGVSRVS
jgi:AraC-like DNA-binding protein